MRNIRRVARGMLATGSLAFGLLEPVLRAVSIGTTIGGKQVQGTRAFALSVTAGAARSTDRERPWTSPTTPARPAGTIPGCKCAS